MLCSLTATTSRRLVATSLLVLTAGLAACGGDDGDDAAGPASTPAEQSPAATVNAALEKVVDTAATAKAASAEPVKAADLDEQIAAVEQGLGDAGFSPSNVGEVGDAKADIVVDTSWAVYVYGSPRSAAEFVLSLKDTLPDAANYLLFRIDNRVYYASMTTPLSADDKAKLNKIAVAAEGAIAAG